MEKLQLKEITNRLTNDMADYGIITGRIHRNAMQTIADVMHAAGWDTTENNSTPDLSEDYRIMAIDQENLHLNPFTVTNVVCLQNSHRLIYYCYSENGIECPIDNLDAYTLVLVAQAVIREYEKKLQK